MEERNLRGVHSGGSRGDNDIDGGDGSNFSGGRNFVGFGNSFNFRNRFIGEDESNFFF